MKRPLFSIGTLLLLACMAAGCADGPGAPDPGNNHAIKIPAGFPAVQVPADNPISSAGVELGRHLFYDRRMSRDGSVACGSCHHQEFAFTDAPNAVSTGFEGRSGTRNSMTLTNVAYNKSFFWDGGVRTLEQQALAPIIHPAELNMDTDSLVARLQEEPRYRVLFRRAWGDETITIARITKSLATFQRTLISGNSPYDKWNSGDRSAMSAAAVRGFDLFSGETGECFHCHTSFNFTDNSIRSNGVDSLTSTDAGLYTITGLERDRGKFKVPTLRNIAVTGPYMHDGRFATLEEVLRHYASGGTAHPNRDPLIRPLPLSEQDQRDIIEFLRALTDEDFLSDTAFSDPWK